MGRLATVSIAAAVACSAAWSADLGTNAKSEAVESGLSSARWSPASPPALPHEAGSGGTVELVDATEDADSVVAAYVGLSLRFMEGPEEERPEVLAVRRWVAGAMTRDEILQAEDEIALRVLSSWGGELAWEKDRLMKLMKNCSGHDCDSAGPDIIKLGPAFPAAIGGLEHLMTANPYWLPREDYAWALAMIGTSAMPAFCRILLDGEELETEGTWNIQVASFVLGEIGAVAREAMPCVVDALTADMSPERLKNADELTLGRASAEVIALEARADLAIAAVKIGDPEGRERMQLLAMTFSGLPARENLAVCWAYAMIYDDPGPAMWHIPTVLDGKDEKARVDALWILVDIAELPNGADAVALLKPRVAKFKDQGSPAEVEAATALLETLGE